MEHIQTEKKIKVSSVYPHSFASFRIEAKDEPGVVGRIEVRLSLADWKSALCGLNSCNEHISSPAFPDGEATFSGSNHDAGRYPCGLRHRHGGRFVGVHVTHNTIGLSARKLSSGGHGRTVAASPVQFDGSGSNELFPLELAASSVSARHSWAGIVLGPFFSARTLHSWERSQGQDNGSRNEPSIWPVGCARLQ